MKTQILDRQTYDKILQDWLDLLNGLVTEVSEWVGHQPGWSVELSTTEITEEPLGSYTAPVLTIIADENGIRRKNKEPRTKGRLILEPIARNATGNSKGFVALYAWPTLYRVRLVDKDNGWAVLTDSGIYLRHPWNETTFIDLAKDLMTA